MGHHVHHQKEEKQQGHHDQEQNHKKHGHMEDAVALGAGAFAIYEHHQVKVDPKHAGRHRVEETLAGATAVGIALHEHHKHHKNHQRGGFL